MYDTRFTYSPVIREEQPVKRSRSVITPEGKYLCDVSKSSIFDLNGEKIAVYTHKEKIIQDGEEIPVRVYESRFGDFSLKGNYLYLNEEFLGTMAVKKKRIPLIFLGLAGFLLALAILFIALIDLPYDEVPIIDVRDENGDWKGQGTIAVFDKVLHPDTEGTYQFIIRNSNEVKLYYDFSITECYNGEKTETFPLEYRIRVNNDLIGSEKWLSGSELQFKDLILMEQSDYLVTLEWRWLFESGDDPLDTYFGESAGQYTLDFFLTAESISEIS